MTFDELIIDLERSFDLEENMEENLSLVGKGLYQESEERSLLQYKEMFSDCLDIQDSYTL